MLALTFISVSILKPWRKNLSPKLYIENPHEIWVFSYSESEYRCEILKWLYYPYLIFKNT